MPEHVSPGVLRNAQLKRTLGMWAIIGLGLGYMTPTVVFDTFGYVSGSTQNTVPLAYLAGLIVMLFTAISYGKLSGQFPNAGSAYTYAKEAIHPNVGFMVGWASLLDYILLPLVNVIIIRDYMLSAFPDVPPWIWVVAFVAITTAIIYLTMRGTSNFNMVLLIFGVAAIVIFVVIAGIQVVNGEGAGTLISAAPFTPEDPSLGLLFTGAALVSFSFIGFDAVTMYVEEAKDPKKMPRAIMLTTLIGGAIFLIASYFAQLRFPDWLIFAPDGDLEAIDGATLPAIGDLIGGPVFPIILLTAGFLATAASGLASHASVSRMLLVMGRNRVLPQRFFGHVSPKTATPTFNILLTGAIGLTAIWLDLATVFQVIAFGALVAFTFVNISALAWFAIRQGQRRTAKDVFRYIVLPLIGTVMTVVLWFSLSETAIMAGLVWAAIGLVYLAIITRGFRRKASGFDEAQPVTGFNKAVPAADPVE